MTPYQQSFEINVGLQSLVVDFVGANRQFAYLELSFTKKMRPRVTGHSQDEYYYALLQGESIIQYKNYRIKKDKNIAV